jgi:hypothetical protein
MRSVIPPAHTQIARCVEPAGSIRIFRLAKRVIINRVEGVLSESMAQAWVNAVEPVFVIGHLEALADWELMTGYAAGARQLLTRWALERRRETLYAHFLVRPGIVAMGVSVAAMTLSVAGLDVHSTTDRQEFEDAVRRRIALAERSRSSVFPPAPGHEG